MGNDPRRFLNGCYFSECTVQGGSLQCDLLPDNCVPYLDSPWEGYDPGICAGGNGNLYFIGLSDITIDGSLPYDRVDLLFSRSSDFGETWGPFTWDPPPDRRMKHICMNAYGPDRCLITAPPSEDDDSVVVYWNDGGHDHIWALRSTDAGENWAGFDGDPEPTELIAVSDPRQVYAPHAAISNDGIVYLTFAHVDFATFVGDIYLCRWDETNGWYPDPARDPITVSGAFPACLGFGPYAERSSPSIAVDCTHDIGPTGGSGPRSDWVYIVYTERRTDPLLDEPANLGRVKFVRSCDGGLTWSSPQIISPDAENPESRQFYPRVRVDGRGNIGVSWYDSRHAASQSQSPEYDVYFAYSSNGGNSWFERRVSTREDAEPFFDSVVQGPPCQSPVDYSGMTADPRPGFSTFYVMAIGTPNGAAADMDIYTYAVHLRPKGDFDGDHDVDDSDAQFNLCLWPSYPICECGALDLNGDGEVTWDDVELFPDVWTGALCDCHGPCHEDPACDGEDSGGGGGAWWDEDALADLPASCDLAKWFVTHVPLQYLQGFVKKVAEYVKVHPDDPQADEMSQFIVCFYAVWP